MLINGYATVTRLKKIFLFDTDHPSTTPDGVKCKILPRFTLDPPLTVPLPMLYCKA